MTEIADFALIVLVVAGGLTLAVVSTKLADFVPIPAPLVFLVAAAVISDFSEPLRTALSIQDVERIAVIALIVILLNGGLEIGWKRMRASAGSVASLGILGTFATAGIVALAAHYILGFDWILAGILGAALAPTDPAVMFSVLGGRELKGRTKTVLEGEAGFNDPAGIALMIGMIELATHPEETFWVVVVEFAKEMSIGAVIGVAAGRLIIGGLHRVRLANEPLYPILVMVLAAVVYGVAGVVGGSGFLAVFIVGLLLGDEPVPQRPEIDRFHSSVASLGEMVVFVALGLTIAVTDLPGGVWLDGLVLAAIVGFVARPAAVALTLAHARDLTRNERLFVMWSGLKGAVPILLAAFAIIGGVAGAEELYGVVFVVVAANVLVQGSLLPTVARRLGVATEG